MPLWKSFLVYQAIPSIFNAGATLLFVLLILKLFRIRNPETRFLFLFLPLLKSFLVLIERNASMPRIDKVPASFGFGLRMPDPFNFFSSPFKEDLTVIYDQSAITIALLVITAIVLSVLVARWVQLFLFLRAFRHEKPLSEAEYPNVYALLDKLVTKCAANRPRVVLSKKFHIVPFSLGHKRPIVVVSKELLESFSDEQLEIMLAHELAHIRRRDNIASWFALILRDIMFFNPVAYLIYGFLEEEKEKTCDKLALEITGATPKQVANTLLDVAIFYRKLKISKQPLYPALSKGLFYNRSLLERRIEFITSPFPGPRGSKVRSSLKMAAFLLLLYIQPVIWMRLGSDILFLH